MRTFLNLLLLIGYGGLASAIAVYGPRLIPGLDQTLAFGFGAVVLLGCGLLHEIYARMGREIDLRHQLATLSYDYQVLQEENDWLQRELDGLRQAFDQLETTPPGEPARRTVETVMAEVKVLRSLIERLAHNQGMTLAPNAGSQAADQTAGANSDELPLRDMPSIATGLENDEVLGLVRQALRDDRVDLVLQPIVSLPQRKRRAYECFSRLRTEDGAVILPEQYISLAEQAGLITAIDNMLLFRCVQLVRKIHRRDESLDFFCNISPHTLADESFFGDFVEFLESNRELAVHLVFEFAQADFARWSEAGAKLLDRLADLGCRFSLDRVRELRVDVAELKARHVAFVKIEGALLLDRGEPHYGLLRALRRHQIDLVVTMIEEESGLVELLDYDVDFGQGYLFGEPRLARPAA